jgi:hypothetical protein
LGQPLEKDLTDIPSTCSRYQMVDDVLWLRQIVRLLHGNLRSSAITTAESETDEEGSVLEGDGKINDDNNDSTSAVTQVSHCEQRPVLKEKVTLGTASLDYPTCTTSTVSTLINRTTSTTTTENTT